ncbi:glycerol-3-phosphate acyltransferase [Virgibacillus sp. W0181]|uniref:glycerol-3-phosphate acyltransferase n=1 Tax=Virgibacillus sp. W0181 TaxID=3391581 RepID=UPI003F471C6D
MYVLLVSLIGYLFGCIHGSQIIGKHKKINIKRNGMKNSGASNTTMLLGWRYGFIVAFIDVFKVVISIFAIVTILSENGIINEAQTLLIYLNALFVVIGHNYPLTMNFNGGKGTASFVGFMLYVDWKFALLGLGMLLLFAWTTDYFVVGTLVMYVSFLAYTLYVYHIGPAIIAFMLIILYVVKHAENYRRIVRNQEIRLSSLIHKETKV